METHHFEAALAANMPEAQSDDQGHESVIGSPPSIILDFSAQPWREKELVAVLAMMIRMAKATSAKPS